MILIFVIVRRSVEYEYIEYKNKYSFFLYENKFTTLNTGHWFTWMVIGNSLKKKVYGLYLPVYHFYSITFIEEKFEEIFQTFKLKKKTKKELKY